MEKGQRKAPNAELLNAKLFVV